MKKVTFFIIPAALIAGCDPRSPETRRESMVRDCINLSDNTATDCANAARMTIPDEEVRNSVDPG